MKVYGVFKYEVLMPYIAETLLHLYSSKDKADRAANKLNKANEDPMEEDCYGPLQGSEYKVRELEVK